ncbi:hypothetical protein BJ508DRAFT_367355 [Ascobolus immersus RN42]|uniref:Galactose oxidase n=1 Tax=Ascobolus immersus RN42 TaxID=1160509 RepID=A0A3N4HJB3_ASCIM|nr:hypothetical protein BJ508DRAFT_367355 [Ascobolus immersus RN42]
MYVNQGERVDFSNYDARNKSIAISVKDKLEKMGGDTWIYDIKPKKWTVEGPSKALPNSTAGAGYALSKKTGKAYFIGGRLEDSGIRPNQLLIHDTKSGDWENLTDSTTGFTVAGMEFPEVVALDGYGTNGGGVLIVFGGIYWNARGELGVVDYDRVHIYDIEKKTWYQQPTRGLTKEAAFPSPRNKACTVTVSAPDNSSHNIYMYGGISTRKGDKPVPNFDNPDFKNYEYFNEVWVLSIPSFTWELVSSKGLFRYDQTCQLLDDRYLVSFGGRKQFYIGECTNFESPLNVQLFDLNELTWTSRYEKRKAKTGYKVPSVLFGSLGGDENGGATMQAPPHGWSDDSVSALFPRVSVRATSPKPNATSIDHDQTSETKNNQSSTPGTSNVPAVVGGAVGGFALLLILVGFLFFLRHRRQTHRSKRGNINGVEMPTSTEAVLLDGTMVNLKWVPYVEADAERFVPWTELSAESLRSVRSQTPVGDWRRRPPVEMYSGEGSVRDAISPVSGGTSISKRLTL